MEPRAAPHHGQDERAAEQPPRASASGRNEDGADDHHEQCGVGGMPGREGTVVHTDQGVRGPRPIDQVLEDLDDDHIPQQIRRDQIGHRPPSPPPDEKQQQGNGQHGSERSAEPVEYVRQRRVHTAVGSAHPGEPVMVDHLNLRPPGPVMKGETEPGCER